MVKSYTLTTLPDHSRSLTDHLKNKVVDIQTQNHYTIVQQLGNGEQHVNRYYKEILFRELRERIR